jgi:hypothetical protein
MVKGIYHVLRATLDICQRAARRKNLIIVHEPTFYNHLDETKDLNGEIYQVSVPSSGRTIWLSGFHDHWHSRRPTAS